MDNHLVQQGLQENHPVYSPLLSNLESGQPSYVHFLSQIHEETVHTEVPEVLGIYTDLHVQFSGGTGP